MTLSNIVARPPLRSIAVLVVAVLLWTLDFSARAFMSRQFRDSIQIQISSAGDVLNFRPSILLQFIYVYSLFLNNWYNTVLDKRIIAAAYEKRGVAELRGTQHSTAQNQEK